MQNKTCKYQKLLFVTNLIFCINLKSSGKIPFTFSRGNQGGAKFRVGLKNMSSLQHSIHYIILIMSYGDILYAHGAHITLNPHCRSHILLLQTVIVHTFCKTTSSIIQNMLTCKINTLTDYNLEMS